MTSTAGLSERHWRDPLPDRLQPNAGEAAAKAVLRLAPSSILQLPFIDARPALDLMTEIARSVPDWRLELGTDLDRIPDRVATILDGSA